MEPRLELPVPDLPDPLHAMQVLYQLSYGPMINDSAEALR